MNLLGFYNSYELWSAGLLAGEPTKGPLLKALEFYKPERVLLIVRENQAASLESWAKGLPVAIDPVTLPPEAWENLTSLVEALRAHSARLQAYGHAALLDSGTPQERAALWLLKHEGLLQGQMTEPPLDYTLAPLPKLKALKASEPIATFDTAEPAAQEPWEAVAAQVGCIGKSARFRQTLEEAAAMAGHPTPILLMGETGCGKEVLARLIHSLSPRGAKPLVTVNCAALPETLAESILFGHEKGAFTGAYKRQTGKFEQASGGTLFLDELGELSLGNQAKLLRVLESRCVDPLGAQEPMSVDVRVIAATNRNLQQEVAAGRFREDLYYRLRAGEIHMPALRERASDIPLIALHLLARINATLAQPKQFSKAALKFLEAQRWPGNVRDLMNTLERAALMCPRAVIEPEDFRVMSEPIRPAHQNGSSTPALYPGFQLETYLQKVRTEIFEKALRQAGGNKSEAARLLGITPQAIHKYLRQQDQAKAMDAPLEEAKA